MAQHPIEMILAQRLASHLATPVFLVGIDGRLLFYNEAAEELFGYRFDETGEVPKETWSALLDPTDDDGNQLPPDQHPLVLALEQRVPTHSSMWIKGFDGGTHRITGTSLPLHATGNRFIGAMAIFWVNGS